MVRAKFNGHFILFNFILFFIFERVEFHRKVQGHGEVVVTFITGLQYLAKHCNYGSLHDEMIRNRIMVGLRNFKVSDKLRSDSELRPEKVIQQARLNEAIKNIKP